MKQLTVFLDANVLYSAGLRDLLIRLALHDLFRIKWSDRIHEEWMSNLLAKRPDLVPEKLERTRRLMMDGVPDSLVTDYEPLIENIPLPDPDDRHVLAAAITGQARVILTFNLRDFPKSALRPYKIEAQHPDKFLSRLLSLKPEQLCAVIRQHRNTLKNPPKTVAEYLEERRKDGLTQTVARLQEFVTLL